MGRPKGSKNKKTLELELNMALQISNALSGNLSKLNPEEKEKLESELKSGFVKKIIENHNNTNKGD